MHYFDGQIAEAPVVGGGYTPPTPTPHSVGFASLASAPGNLIADFSFPHSHPWFISLTTTLCRVVRF